MPDDISITVSDVHVSADLLSDPVDYIQASKQLLAASSLLFLRAFSMLGQVVGKRIILSQKDESLLVAFAGLAALEDFIFVFGFNSLSFL